MISNSEGALSDCVQDCSKFDSNTYGDTATLTCQACNSKCKTCVNGLATGCLSCNNDDIFSKTSATDVGGSCKVKSDQKNEYKQKSASDITSSSADELQQQATEIVEAFSQTVTTTTATTTSDDNNDGTTDTTDSTATKEIVTTQSKEEIEQEQEKKKELIAAVITTAKEMSAKDDLTTTEAKSLVEAMKYSVKPEVSVTMVTSDGEKVESTALADDSTEEVARKFEKDEAITICDTLTNIADKIDVKENKEVTEDMFSAASDLLKQTSTLQQDKKVAKGQIESINENADETKQEQIKEDMEVVKKVVEFCDTLSKKIKEKLSPGESMKFNTTEMKLQVNKFSTGDKNSLKESIVSSLSYIETTATTTATTTDTTDGTTTDGTNIDGTTTDSTTQYYNENGEQVDETDPTRTINPPEVIIKDQLIDNLNDQLDKLREQGKNVDSLTVKKASFDLDINSLSKNTSNETEGTTVSDFTRASHLQQFGFELDDGTKVNISDLADDAQFEIQFDYIPETSASYSCVYWNEETEQYDSTGVYLDPATKKCKAKHLTDFIVQKIKNNNKHVFNYGILAVVIPIAICIILFSVWFFRNKKHQVTSFESIGDDIDFTTLSPFISIWKTKTIPEALNKTMHLACYLISVMMFLALFFRDSVDIDSSFDKLLAAGLVFGLSFTIIIKYFLGAIKEYTQSQPWIYFVVSICYFAACSGITIWRMNSLNSDEAWNWFHSMYIIFVFDFVILDTLIIVALKIGLWKKWKKIQAYFSFGGFLIIPKGQSEQMQAKGTPILDLERGRKSSSSDKQQFSNDVVVVDNLAEGEQFGSRPQSKSGMLKN